MAGNTIAPNRPPGGRFLMRLATGVVLGVLSLWAGSDGAFAQDAQVQGLIDRVDRLQRELVTLQRQVYRGEPPQAPAAAPTASPSAAPSAAPGAGSGGLTTTTAPRIELRMSQLEAQLRQLTGEIEEMSYRQTQLRGQIDKLAADTDLRLQRLEQGAPGVGEAMPTEGQLLGQPLAGAAPAPGDGTPGILGTVPAQDLEALKTERVEPASPTYSTDTAAAGQAGGGYMLRGATPDEQYKNAFNLLSQANYGEAELALRTFVEQHPDDPLAGNAKYWLGETYYVRQDYQQAAITFAEAYQRYPDNAKAPDNLLKLGMSLSSLGSKADACGTFVELLKRYPNSAVTIQQRAKQERQRLGCP